ncbi:MAG: Type 1 glutamine amidotransferase-like domain-containing protein [Polyangiales bacterium]
MTTRQIVAMGGGGFSMEPDNPLLDDWLLGLAARERPRVCFVPTASGDSDGYVTKFYEAFADKPCEPRHLSLFRRRTGDLRALVLSQDIMYVGGGNTANMLAVWRLHGLDAILRDAWERGVVLCGLSAGSLCWFEGGVTDSFGRDLHALQDGLGLLEGSHCPHYDGEPERRPSYQRLVTDGTLPGGWAIDDGAAVRFEGTEVAEVVASRSEARAYRVAAGDDGAIERPVHTRYLGG